MGEWKEVCRCRDCGRIYPNGIPYICKVCGARIGKATSILTQAFGGGEVTLTDKCEKAVARKKLFGWEVRPNEETSE